MICVALLNNVALKLKNSIKAYNLNGAKKIMKKINGWHYQMAFF